MTYNSEAVHGEEDKWDLDDCMRGRKKDDEGLDWEGCV